jgi:two-component system, OmpR family, sensor histidine kinase CpxA
MKARLPLFTKVLALALLNLALLVLALAFVMRVQFRMDARSFLLGPAQDRIMAVAHGLALELEETDPGGWDAVLARYSNRHGALFALFDEWGERIAGAAVPLPREVAERIPRRVRRRDGPGPGARRPADERKNDSEKGRERRAPAPPLFLLATSGPTQYWAGARIPVRLISEENPKPGTLLMMSPSALGNALFFDVKPWLIVAAAVIFMSAAVWFPFIRGLTSSIRQMTVAAGQIAEGRFEIHVADHRRDEIGQLGEAINRMAARLSGFVTGQKRFLGGIAHELCTPIATIQFGLGNLERRVTEEQKETVAEVQDEAQHMSALVNELLSFSKAGMQGMDVKLVPVDVAGTVSRVVEREGLADCPIAVDVPRGLCALADGETLYRALANVVRNALRYAGHAGPIVISAREAEGKVRISVLDHGPGVPAEALEEIFTPFYRVDPSRNQQTGGVGLGLAIVKASVESCRGTVRCRNRQPSGLEVEIVLEQAFTISSPETASGAPPAAAARTEPRH